MEPSVSAGYAMGLIELARSKGVPPDALIAHAGLERRAFDNLDNRIAFPRYVALMRQAKALSGDAALALHFGEAANLAKFSIIGVIGHGAETFSEAFPAFNRFVRLIVDVESSRPDRFELARRGGALWLVDRRRAPEAFPELTESAFANLVSSTREFGERPLVRRVHVTHPDPGYRSEYERILGAPVVFEADWNAMQLDAVWPATKVKALPPYIGEVVIQHAEALLKQLEASGSVRGRVEALLVPMLPTGGAGVDEVSRKLGLSRQTLYRQLKAEGVTFELVLDELRRRLAMTCLGDRRTSVHETAYQLGFSDPTAFSRAFKRWTGRSPRALRAEMG